MKEQFFCQNIENWYLANKRDLPWRHNPNPYHVWIAEIVFQQTQIAQGLAYYNRFVSVFPDVHSLAGADQDAVLKLWEGLGYYSRARNMHKAAKILASNDCFPKSAEEWQALPGVGPYTAAAISSVCFDEKVASVDGNVIRVIARTHFIEDDIRMSKTVKQIQAIADELIAFADKPGDFNQGLMELGATICKPKTPQCSACPLQSQCTFHRSDALPSIVPFKSKPQKRKERHLHFLFASDEAFLFLKKRDETDIWAGLYELPGIEMQSHENPFIADHFCIIKKNTHLLTHQKIHYYIWDIKKWQNSPISLRDFVRFEKGGLIPALPRPLKIFVEEKLV